MSPKNTPAPTEAERVEMVRACIRNANGADRFYRHELTGRQLVYTSGVKAIADLCGAYWLIDAIASYQTKTMADAEPFQVWTLAERPDSKLADRDMGALLLATDGGRDDHEPNVIARQEIAYTDFPRELLKGRDVELYLEDGHLMLPGER